MQLTRRVNWRQHIVNAEAGFHGTASLAAALTVPLTTLSSTPFPDRSLIIYVVTAIILITTLLQGSTLPVVIRWARMPENVAHAEKLPLARSVGAQTALDVLPAVTSERDRKSVV